MNVRKLRKLLEAAEELGYGDAEVTYPAPYAFLGNQAEVTVERATLVYLGNLLEGTGKKTPSKFRLG